MGHCSCSVQTGAWLCQSRQPGSARPPLGTRSENKTRYGNNIVVLALRFARKGLVSRDLCGARLYANALDIQTDEGEARLYFKLKVSKNTQPSVSLCVRQRMLNEEAKREILSFRSRNGESAHFVMSEGPWTDAFCNAMECKKPDTKLWKWLRRKFRELRFCP